MSRCGMHCCCTGTYQFNTSTLRANTTNSPFIVYRSLNALIDDRLEDALQTMAANKKFGSWEMLTMYLQMHPANPEQAFVARENITWMMIIRMVSETCFQKRFNNGNNY
jgi:hypothetical protein